MIVQYVRDENRNPFAVVVATDRNEIGVAACNPKDKFNKKIGRMIAAGRAKSDKHWTHYVIDDRIDDVYDVVHSIRDRSVRYYK